MKCLLLGIRGHAKTHHVCIIVTAIAAVAALLLSVFCAGLSHKRRAFRIQMMNGGWLLPVSGISTRRNHKASWAMKMVKAALISVWPLGLRKTLKQADTTTTSGNMCFGKLEGFCRSGT